MTCSGGTHADPGGQARVVCPRGSERRATVCVEFHVSPSLVSTLHSELTEEPRVTRFGWHYLYIAACQIRPFSRYACFVASWAIKVCYTSFAMFEENLYWTSSVRPAVPPD